MSFKLKVSDILQFFEKDELYKNVTADSRIEPPKGYRSEQDMQPPFMVQTTINPAVPHNQPVVGSSVISKPVFDLVQPKNNRAGIGAAAPKEEEVDKSIIPDAEALFQNDDELFPTFEDIEFISCPNFTMIHDVSPFYKVTSIPLVEFLKTNEKLLEQLEKSAPVANLILETPNPSFCSPYCDENLRLEILKVKTVFDKVDQKSFMTARYRASPYEKIGNSLFINRAAIKMANVNAVTKICEASRASYKEIELPVNIEEQPSAISDNNPTNFSENPQKIQTDEEGPDQSSSNSSIATQKTLRKKKEILAEESLLIDDEQGIITFADVCAGPGGFTEYMFWKYGDRAQGFGYTLRGPDDFKFDKYPPDLKDLVDKRFRAHYGVDNTGDITKNDNLKAFQAAIDEATNGRGVSVMMADGGFSVTHDYNTQEILMEQLILCQFLCGLMIVRQGGNFMCKIFDSYTKFMTSLIYILYQHFDEISILKPISSRPANSERYVICRKLRQRCPPIVNQLLELNAAMNAQKNFTIDSLGQNPNYLPLGEKFKFNPSNLERERTCPTDIWFDPIVSMIDEMAIEEDVLFTDYIKRTNIRHGNEQLFSLKRIYACVFSKEQDSREIQLRLKKECLELWGLPKEEDKGTTQYNYSSNNRNNLQRTRRFYNRNGRGGGSGGPRQDYITYNQNLNSSFVGPDGQQIPFQNPMEQNFVSGDQIHQMQIQQQQQQQQNSAEGMDDWEMNQGIASNPSDFDQNSGGYDAWEKGQGSLNSGNYQNNQHYNHPYRQNRQRNNNNQQQQQQSQRNNNSQQQQQPQDVNQKLHQNWTRMTEQQIQAQSKKRKRDENKTNKPNDETFNNFRVNTTTNVNNMPKVPKKTTTAGVPNPMMSTMNQDNQGFDSSLNPPATKKPKVDDQQELEDLFNKKRKVLPDPKKQGK